MFQIDVSVNFKNIGNITVVNTGYKRKSDGKHLYRIKDEELNHLEIWHNRENHWTVLCYEIFTTIDNYYGAKLNERNMRYNK